MRIRVYSTTHCTKCAQLKDYLGRKGLEFENIDLHADPTKMAELQNIAPGTRSVPVMVLGEGDDMQVIHGFDEPKLNELFA